MLISLVAALDIEGTIGIGGALPWRLPDDLRRFKSLTLGRPVVMGRRTFESIGRPLPKRTNIVLTGQRDYHAAGCVVVHSVHEALEAAARHDAGGGRDGATAAGREVMIIGGAIIYALFLPLADRFYLTRVHARVRGDTHFPHWDEAHWREIEREDHDADDRHAHAFSFVTLERAGHPARETS